MTKKNTRSCSHKRIKAALCAAMCSALTAMPAFATNGNNAAATTGTTVWTKASEIMQDVYSQIISISTVTAVVCAAVALLLMNFSKNGKTVDDSRAWLKRICHHLGDSERSWLHYGLRHPVLPGRHLESVSLRGIATRR